MRIEASYLQSQRIFNTITAAQQQSQKAIGALSSGQRIQQASDDSAGLGIASRLTANIRTRKIITQGLYDGLSYVRTADAGLETIQALLQRANILAVQGANPFVDNHSLNQEYQHILQEIDRIVYNTVIFDRYPLLNGYSDPGAPIPPALIPAIWDFIVPQTPYIFSSGLRSLLIPAGTRDFSIYLDEYQQDDTLQIFTRDGHHLIGFKPTDLQPGSFPINSNLWQDLPVYDGFVDSNGQMITTSSGTIAIQSIADLETNVLQPEYGFLDDAHYDDTALLSTNLSTDTHGNVSQQGSYHGMTLDFFRHSGDGQNVWGNSDTDVPETVSVAPILTEDLIVIIVGQGLFEIEFNGIAPSNPTRIPGTLSNDDSQNTPHYLPIGATVHPDDPWGTIDLIQTPSDTGYLGLAGSHIHSTIDARTIIARIQHAIDRISENRSLHAQRAVEIEAQIENLEKEDLAERSLRGHIVDADIAQCLAKSISAQLSAGIGQIIAVDWLLQQRSAVIDLLNNTKALQTLLDNS
jgi:flagellin